MNLLEISNILSKEDVTHLINRLYKRVGNISKIAEETELSRKTIYKYLRGKIKDVKEDTKFRIIGASLLYNKEYTLTFILTRLETLLSSVAYTSIGFLYKRLIESETFDKFEPLYSKLLKIYQENQYFLAKNFQTEVNNIIDTIRSEKSHFVQAYQLSNLKDQTTLLRSDITDDLFIDAQKSLQRARNLFPSSMLLQSTDETSFQLNAPIGGNT